MGTLIAALVKYADSDSTKDPVSDDEKTGKGKRNGNGKGQQHNPGNQGGNKRKADGNPEFVAVGIKTGGSRVGGPKQCVLGSTVTGGKGHDVLPRFGPSRWR